MPHSLLLSLLLPLELTAIVLIIRACRRDGSQEAACVHHYETRGYRDPAAWHLDTGNGQYGGMQFSSSTWRSVGGRGVPARSSRGEQLHRAYRVWKRDGGSWREWSTAGLCGLR